jgi:hypothetical protein
VIPSTINFFVVIDIVLMLSENCSLHTNFQPFFRPLFNYLKATDTPTPNKEKVLSVFAKIIHCFKSSPSLYDEFLSEFKVDIKDLKEEMFNLYQVGKT